MHAAPHYDFAHATAALIAIAILLAGLALLAVKQVHEQVRVYAVQSVFAAGYTLLIGIDRADVALIVLAALTAAIKVVLIPVAIDLADHPPDLRARSPAGRPGADVAADRGDAGRACLLVGSCASASSSATAPPGARHPAFPRAPGSLRPPPPMRTSQIVGLLVLENGVFLATVAIAPGLPFVIGFLLLLDLLPAVLFYGVFARLIAARAKSTSIEDMAVLRG